MYIKRVLIALDQLANALFGPLFNLFSHGSFRGPWGFPDETISGVIGKYKEADILDSHPFIRFLSRFLDWLQEGHVERAVEEEEGMSVERLKELG